MPPNVGSQGPDNLYQTFWIILVNFQIKKHQSPQIFFEKYALTFHYRLGGCRPYVSQTQYSCTIGNDRHQVSFGSILINIIRNLLNGFAWFGNPGRISQRQI